MSDDALFSNLKTKAFLLGRYALAGGLTSGVYMLVYNPLVYFGLASGATSGVQIWGHDVVVRADVLRFVSSNIAYVCALLVQYSAHGKFTFGHREKDKGVLFRYLVAVGFGFLMAAVFSQANTKMYTLPDGTVSLIVMVLVAISNFFFFNFWVYSHKPTAKSGTSNRDAT
jgi:putative flippase GtrA